MSKRTDNGNRKATPRNREADSVRRAIYAAFGYVHAIRARVLKVALDYAVHDSNGAQGIYVGNIVRDMYLFHSEATEMLWECWGYPLRMNPAAIDRATAKAIDSIKAHNGLAGVIAAGEMLGRYLNRIKEPEQRRAATWLMARYERFEEPCKQFIDDYEDDGMNG